MLKGISKAARAMKNQTARNDVIANNLANASTRGFKKEVSLFRQVTSGDGVIETIVQTVPSHEQGPITRTGRSLDMAIQGDGFFVLETDNGERYTRNGSFVMDAEGYLVSVDGHHVSSAAGSLQLPAGAVRVSREGTITVDGTEVGRIKVVRFEDASALENAGSSLFRAPDGVTAEDVPEEGTVVLSGFIEESNVGVVREMTDMIAALKAYEVAQKALKSQDEILRQLVGTVGRTGTSA